MQPGDHLYLIDGSGYIFRAYHALPPLTRKSDGLPVGAVQGFCNMLNKLLRDTKLGERPTHLAVVFDKSGTTFRNALYEGYKANRPEAPADLIPQFALIRQATAAFNVACIEQEGFEADDLIATYADMAVAQGASVRIVSSDKDLMQLVAPGIRLYDTMKDKEIGEEQVLEKFGVAPDRVIDVQALAGDSVDNVPGVPGIGVKTGAQLIHEYGDLESLLNRASEIKQPKRRESLIQFADQARLSKALVTLKRDVPVTIPLDDFAIMPSQASKLIGFLKAMEFTALTRRIASEIDADPSAIDPIEVDISHWTPEASPIEAAALQPIAQEAAPQAQSKIEAAATVVISGPQELAQKIAQKMKALPIQTQTYECVQNLDALEKWIERARAQGHVAIDTETSSLDALQAELIGISMAVTPGEACYVPLNHRHSDGLDFGGGIEQVDFREALARFKALLEDASILKIGQNFKYDMAIFANHGIHVQSADCTMLMSYTLDLSLIHI